MAFVTYLIAPCAGGSAINVDFNSSSLPTVGGNYYLTFTGLTTIGCYEIVDSAEPGVGVDVVSTMSIDYGDCATCLAVPTPTPTTTITPTPSVTPPVTATKTPTPTSTPTTTTSSTPTPSVTTTKTPTATVTQTPSQTPSQTQTGTPNATPTPTKTPNATPTQTGTPAVTPTQTGTPAATPNATPTPTPTAFYTGITVNEFYAYTAEMEGSFSGGTLPPGTVVPHPAWVSDQNNGNTIQVIQANAVALGGFNGLNN